MSSKGRRIYSIAPGDSFVDALATGLLDRFGETALGLAPVTLLLPTRRSCRALREAFLRESGGRPLLLPSLQPLGDLEVDELLLPGDGEDPAGGFEAEVPPAISPLKRHLLLTRLVLRWGERQAEAGRGEAFSADKAARLAEDLARLLDQVQTEGLDFERLGQLVPEDFAQHWQQTLEFLSIVTEHWPRVLAEEGCIDPAERRARLLRLQAEAWQHSPTPDPVIAAGSTGSIPASAELIATIAALPQGMVVLPGPDLEASEAEWEAVGSDPAHPQFGLAQLLRRIGVERAEVRPWSSGSAEAGERTRLVNRALQPAAFPFDWPGSTDEGAMAALRDSLAAVTRIDCAGPWEEATIVALIMRWSLEQEGRRAALVTPDRSLARRVASELERWGITVDDSAGIPLGNTRVGLFLRHTAELVSQRLAPLALLTALKHPLAAGGLDPAGFRRRVRALELAVLRGPRPAPGFAGLRGALHGKGDRRDLIDWLERLEQMAGAFGRALFDPTQGLERIIASHLRFAEQLAASDRESGAERLWAGEDGEAAAGLMSEFLAASGAGLTLSGERYPAFLASVMSGAVVRPRFASHPRLSILGPLEARLQHSDVTILAGLNERTWPAETDAGPWLSRPMRRDFGLPAPERRIGLAAHDFAQAFAAPRLFLTRSRRVEGTPTVPSRWLLRLEALLKALGLDDSLERKAPQWHSWAASLDAATPRPRPEPPSPRPPLAARPRRFSVTDIEALMRDPYALYAKKILRLTPLDPIDADPGAADRGTLIHKVLELFLARHPDRLPEDPRAVLLAIGAEVFAPLRATPTVWAFWWPRFERIAGWVAKVDAAERARSEKAWAEARGEIELAAPAGPATLVAKADRIERLADGSLVVIDYKTGTLPKTKDIARGASPQLPLEAAIIAQGGFEGIPAGIASELAFWRLSGGEPAGEIKLIGGDPAELGARALAGARDLIALFDDPETPYRALPRADWAPSYNDYLHLARVKEWSLAREGDGS